MKDTGESDEVEELRSEVSSLRFDLRIARREAWQYESQLYAAIIVAVVIAAAALFANDPSGFGDLPTWQKVLVLAVVLWVVAIPVLLAMFLLVLVVSAVRRWWAASRGMDSPD